MGPLRYTEDQTLPITIAQLRPFWRDIFADGTVDLPEGTDRPPHWDDAELEAGLTFTDPTSPFANAWRDWAAEAHPDVTIAPDWPR